MPFAASFFSFVETGELLPVKGFEFFWFHGEGVAFGDDGALFGKELSRGFTRMCADFVGSRWGMV